MKKFDAPGYMRRLLASGEPIARPAVSSPMMARIAEKAGFKCLGIGGYAMGAHTCITEPLLTMTELADDARKIQAAVSIPTMVDIGAGFGEAIQVYRTIQVMEQAGIAGVQMEDQVFPKRAHYHRDYQERTISQEHMLEKIRAAKEAASNDDFVLMARTDAMKTHGYDEGVERANAYAKAGADIIMVFPNDIEETRRAPKDIDAPLVYVVSHGNRVDRPVPTFDELAGMGYRIISYAIISTLSVHRALEKTFSTLAATGVADFEPEETIRGRKAIEDLIGLERLYEIEEWSTEKSASGP